MGSMLRLVDGMLYRGKPADEFELTVHRLGNGHAEASVRRTVWWEELNEATPDDLALWAQQREDSAEERREANRQRAARRATTRVRRLAKVAGMDALLTLTYRELQEDLSLCKKHLKEFNRRMRRLIPGWRWVADPEVTIHLRPGAPRGPRLATLEEIFAMKCLVAADRSKTRDWFDLYTLMRDHGFTPSQFEQVFATSRVRQKMEIALNKLTSGRPHELDEGYDSLLANPPTL
jgi:hypothetical protein